MMSMASPRHRISTFSPTNVALYRETKEIEYQDEAVAQLTQALEFWKKYTDSSLELNINPLWTNRVGYVNWDEITEWVEDDIEIARSGENLN